uniref:ATP synthase complex subunit 8 n=1 Tax=Gibbium aequinoctiale TaxID=1050274 RepID=A0A8J9QYU3_9COLE|nr:ATP synthase F0 subunit 8 [Gibbium aequinoctiale]ATN40780.1 ATP synthase F0 subunit 8 [Gibbium aequinoctiale]
MPQMAPLSWSILYLTFLTTLTLTCILNSYAINQKIKKNAFQKKSISTNWKW